jgi:Zn-dependent peptidase ImmA (M78 family)
MVAAGQLASFYEADQPPYSLARTLENYGVREVRDRLLDRDARLILEDGHPVIEVNPLFPRVRRRLSIAHEIGHMIVNECAGRARFHISHGDAIEEACCNNLAGVLLAPDAAVRRFFAASHALGDWKDQVRCSTILEAARSFEVSVDVMARRVFHDLALAPSKIAIIWRDKENSASRRSERALRISSAWHALAKTTFIPLNKTIASTSIIHLACRSGETLCGDEVLALGALRGTFAVEAKRFGSTASAGGILGPLAVLSLLDSIPPALKSSSA